MRKKSSLLMAGVLIYFLVPAQINSTAGFFTPDTVCVNAPVSITNTSVNASTYYWNFCVGNLNTPPQGENLGTINSAVDGPVYIDYVQDNGAYYGFVTDNHRARLYRLDFGNSLLNTPAFVDLGTVNNVIPQHTEGLQVIKNEGKWYAIIVGGDPGSGATSRIIKVEFGANIANNSPTATDWGNIGGISYPHDLYVFNDNSNWYGLTVNTANNTITRFNFTNSFSNTPAAVNLGNIGNLHGPTGIHAVSDNGHWYAFVTNANSSSLTRLDFGNSLLNMPTGQNLGNINNVFHTCWDIYILRFCGEWVGYIINAEQGYNDIIKLDFHNDISNSPTAVSFGNIGNLNFPHCLSKIFRAGPDLYSFIPNVVNHTISRLRFTGCSNSNIPNSTDRHPPPVTYNTPGIYNINLTTDDGLPTQSSFCKQVVVLPGPVADFSFKRDACRPLEVMFTNESTNSQSVSWDFGNGTQAGNESSPVVQYNADGQYTVQLKATGTGKCPVSTINKQVAVRVTNDNVILTNDTVLCMAGSIQLQAATALSYCWTPTTGLSNARIANPVASISGPITYYVNAEITGSSLIVNGDFSNGNTGFTSQYQYANPNITEGQYFVGPNPQSWNGSLSSCGDHTTGNGNMLLVNGSPAPDVKVWSQTIPVTPNTNFAFSTWIQALWPPNPAQLSFSINGVDVGNMITASLPTCTWTQFYTIWNSGNTTSATISIVNKNTQVQGNDFALDDISFAPVFIKRDSVSVTIEHLTVLTNNDTTVCSDRAVPLQATGAHTYAWSPSTGLSDAAAGNPVAMPTASTEYIVTGTSVHGCQDKDTVNVTVVPKPLIVPFHDTLICPGTSVRLQASAGLLTYAWSPATTLDDASLQEPLAMPVTSTMYTVDITDANNCAYADSIAVQIRAIAFSVSRNQVMCEDATVQLKASGGDLYQWSPEGSLDDPFSATPVAAPETSTQYRVHISETTCGHDTTLYTSIIVNPRPIITTHKSNDINCQSPSSQLQVRGALSYLWSPASAVDDPTKPICQAGVDTTTMFYVKGTNEYGCSTTDSIKVFVTAEGMPSFVVPNAFTPNNDFRNDCVGIKKWGSAIIEEFSIYSRWGERVFTTNNPRECWNGWYKGKLMDSGAYAYVIKAKTFCGHIKRTGVILLIR